jgi:hypothetical protein
LRLAADRQRVRLKCISVPLKRQRLRSDLDCSGKAWSASTINETSDTDHQHRKTNVSGNVLHSLSQAKSCARAFTHLLTEPTYLEMRKRYEPLQKHPWRSVFPH